MKLKLQNLYKIIVFNSLMKTASLGLRQLYSSKFKIMNQKYSPIWLLFPLSLRLGFSWTAKKPDPVEDYTMFLSSADSLFEDGKLEQCYQLLISSSENDVEIKWRICRVLYNMAKSMDDDKSLKKDYITQAFDIAKGLLNSDPTKYVVHKWYAILLDAKSALQGIKERIKHMEEVKQHMQVAVTLNPKDATTLHMLGEWCYQVAKLPWHQRKIAELFFSSPPQSTYDEALDYFLKAENVQPRFYSVNLLRLGDCYLQLRKEDQAEYYLQLAATYPAKSNDDHFAKKEAANMLKKIKK